MKFEIPKINITEFGSDTITQASALRNTETYQAAKQSVFEVVEDPGKVASFTFWAD